MAIVFAIQFLRISAAILPSSPARLAIISNPKSDANAAATLSVELSKFGNLELFERDEIDKVRREQSLSAGNQDCLKLGRIIGADGLLLLESTRAGTNQFLTTRLIAVKPGVILSSARFLQPFNPVEWAPGFARQISAFAPKLSVLAKDAIPISIVGIRSSVKSKESEEMERALTALAIEELSREPKLFVLERRRMQLLSSEKEFNGMEDSPFWNGSYLLDGVIDRDSYSRDVLKLNIRLVPPQGAEPMLIELACPRTNFPQIVPQLKAKVIEALKLNSSAPAWNPENESEQYFEDAKWAMKWGLLDEAQSACEASWALGKNTPELAELRIRVYLEKGTPQQIGWYVMNPTHPGFAPDFSRLQPAVRAFELFQQNIRPAWETQGSPSTNAYLLAVDLLEGASQLLQQFYAHPESRAGNEDELAELRLLARQTCALMEKHRWPYKVYPKHRMFIYGNKDIAVSENPSLADIELRSGGFWCETPDDCISIYRKYANAGFLHKRGLFESPVIIAWRAADLPRTSRLWHEFIQELCGSTNNLVNVEGYYLAYAGVARDDSKERAARASLFQAAVQGASDFAMARLSIDLATDINHLIYQDNKEKIDAAAKFHRDFTDAVSDGFKKRELANMKAYLTTNTVFDQKSFETVFYSYPRDYDFQFQAADVIPLLPLLDEYETRLKQGNTPASSRQFKDAAYFIQRARTWCQNVIQPEQKTATYTVPAKPSFSFAESDCFQVNHFWSIPYQRLDCRSDGIPDATILHAMFRGGKIWLNVASDAGSAPRRTLFAVNPSNFKADIIEVPFKNSGQFEVLGESLYLSTDAGLKRYAFREQTWEDLNIPVETGGWGHCHLSLVDGRLFLTTSDTIIELKEGKKESLILASARRRPAANVLDTLDQYGSPTIFPGPGHSLRAMINGKIYTSDETAASWTETAVLPHSNGMGGFDSFDEGCLFRQVTADQKTFWWGMPNNRSSLERLLSEKKADYEMPASGTIYFSRAASSADETTYWSHPLGVPLQAARVTTSGDTIWFLANRLILEGYNHGEATLKKQMGSHAVLVSFRNGQAQAKVTPLCFFFRSESDRDCAWVATDAEGGGQHVRFSTPQGFREEITIGPSLFFATSQGLVVTGRHIPGFWLIPFSNTPQTASRSDPSDANASLCAAAERGDVAAMTAALARGAAIESRDDRGWTPLILACKAGALDAVKLLVEKGADVNARSLKKDGNFALIFAVDGGNPGVVKLLLDRGANLNAQSGAGKVTALYAASVHGSKAVAEVLISRGADPNEPGFTDEYGRRQTPLTGAACTGHGDTIEFLLASGARLEQKNNFEVTALMETARCPYSETLKLLISKGANVNASTADGHTALIYAAYNARNENVKLLLAAGADPAATANDGDGKDWNAAEWAEQRGHRETAVLIRDFKR